MEIRFSDEILTRILEQSMIYACACPAQICRILTEQRILYRYQLRCINNNETEQTIHQRINSTLTTTHALLEQCLADILELEEWDMQTYQMPEALVQKHLAEFELSMQAQNYP